MSLSTYGTSERYLKALLKQILSLIPMGQEMESGYNNILR